MNYGMRKENFPLQESCLAILLGPRKELHMRQDRLFDYDPNYRRSRMYETLLDSRQWQNLRDRVFRRDKWRCGFCFLQPPVEVHHLTYGLIAKEASDYDCEISHLVGCCRNCHELAKTVWKEEWIAVHFRGVEMYGCDWKERYTFWDVYSEMGPH